LPWIVKIVARALPVSFFGSAHFKQHLSFPRRVMRPGRSHFRSSLESRGSGAPRGAKLRPRCEARPATPCEAWARLAIDALASRRSTVAIYDGPGPRFLNPAAIGRRTNAASSSQPGRSAWRAGPRRLPSLRVQAPAFARAGRSRGRHSLLRLGCASGGAPR